MRGATLTSARGYGKIEISIHAPLAGCDYQVIHFLLRPQNFNPRTPCGVRLKSAMERKIVLNFNPRTPCGVRLDRADDKYQRKIISIHAPLAGCDAIVKGATRLIADFNPRTPCGVRRWKKTTRRPAQAFQSTHPLRGATIHLPHRSRQRRISIHAPLAGCDSRLR